MKTQSVRLSDSYCLIEGILQTLAINPEYIAAETAAWNIDPDGDEQPDESYQWKIERYIWVPAAFQIGSEVILYSVDDEFQIMVDNGHGVIGNSAPIGRYHGWRGTTDGHSKHAHGLREILGFRELKSGIVRVKLSADLATHLD